MGSWTAFWLTYLFGGLTFIPLVIAAILLHAHLTLPVHDAVGSARTSDADNIVQPGDDTSEIDAAQKEESRQKVLAHSDVAAGYFAVCREYTPMGINAKPIERSTPVGPTAVASPSPSVYQTMYRSIFDRKQAPGPLDDNKSVSQRPKRAGNVFYVVLRHGHLMLFDDDEQIEVRHVISLANHDVSIYSGGDRTPEGELFIKRNAICLARRVDGKENTPDMQLSKPFYLFSENCSAKEDFYFALLRNQEQTFAAQHIAPKPQRFDVKNIISLVQKLHASEDHTQTRWLNALIGRVFLGIHQTKDIENLIREKLTKKISRVKRPSFLTRVAIQGISTGDSAPFITNPRLKDLNVEGELVTEADIKYTGNFRLEVAATARIDLGQRFKAREVNLVLAVVLRKLEGHVLFKVKPPPSNRIWFCFQSTPKMEMSIEPIVSSRQITYTVILRQIENRIKEVVAETLVSPFWDDTPFFSTDHKIWRGGIFDGDDEVVHSPDHATIAAQLGNVEEVSQIEQTTTAAPVSPELPPLEKNQSVPVKEDNHSTGFWARKPGKKSPQDSTNQLGSASTTALDVKHTSSSSPDIPLPLRSPSISQPVIGTEPTHAEAFKPTTTAHSHEDAISAMETISARSRTHSSTDTTVGSLSKSQMNLNPNPSSDSSSEVMTESVDVEPTPKGSARRHTASSSESLLSNDRGLDSPGLSSRASIKSASGSISRGLFARKEPPSPGLPDGTAETKNKTLTAMSNAAATAKRWGWNAIQRQAERTTNGRKLSDPPVDLNQPMGRGQPLPPPGTPLPRPGEMSLPTSVPKRKSVAPSPERPPKGNRDPNEPKPDRRPPPPIPRRRRVSEIHDIENTEENLLVVAAPTDSDMDSPSIEDTMNHMGTWAEEPDEKTTGRSLRDSPPAGGNPTKWPEFSNSQALARGSVTNYMGQGNEEEDYSNWMDNSEVEDTEVIGGKTKQ